MSGIVILLAFWLYLDASISTRLPGSPSMHRLQAATWPARLSAGRESGDVSIGGLDMRRGNDKERSLLCSTWAGAARGRRPKTEIEIKNYRVQKLRWKNTSDTGVFRPVRKSQKKKEKVVGGEG